MEAPAVAGDQRYDMDQGYPQGYTQQEVEGKINIQLNQSDNSIRYLNITFTLTHHLF